MVVVERPKGEDGGWIQQDVVAKEDQQQVTRLKETDQKEKKSQVTEKKDKDTSTHTHITY